jgi:hypothetical protein
MNIEPQIVGNNPSGNNVWIGDQFTPIIDAYLVIPSNSGKLLASGVSEDSRDCVFTAGHGASIGDTVCIKEGDKWYQAKILNVATNDIELDTPFDFAFTTNADVVIGDHDLSVDGSSSPVIAGVCPPSGAVWDITRLIIHMEDDTIMDSSKFAGGSALVRGVVFRHKNDIKNNIFNVKTNGELGERAYDIEYDSKAPAGVFGFRCRRSFGGQDKNGVVIRIYGDRSDEVQVIIQDDLTGINHIHFIVQGHVTTSQGGL